MEAPEEQKWIDDVLAGMSGSQRAEPPAELWDRIEQENFPALVARSPRWVRWAAAVALIALNVVVARQFTLDQSAAPSEISYYAPVSANLNYYAQ